MSGLNMEVDDGAGALGGGEECNCEGACACGRKVDGDAAVEEEDAEESSRDGGSDVSSGDESCDSDSDESLVLDADGRQVVPKGMAAETLAIIREDGRLLGGRRVDPENLPSTGGPVVPPWMNIWTDMPMEIRDLSGLRQVAVSLHKVVHPEFENMCAMQVVRHGCLPDFFLVVDAARPDDLRKVAAGAFRGESVIWWAPRNADGVRYAVQTFMSDPGECEFWSWHDEETHRAPRWSVWPSRCPVKRVSAFLELPPVLDFLRSVDKAVKACPPGSGPAVPWIIRELLDGAKSWKDMYRGHRNRRPVYVPEVLFGSMAKRPGLKEGVAASNQLICDAMRGLYFIEKDMGAVEEQPDAEVEGQPAADAGVVVPEVEEA